MQGNASFALVIICVAVYLSAPALGHFAEEFSKVSQLSDPEKGWVFTNRSKPSPSNTNNWTQGNTDVFKDRTGRDDSYAAVSFESVGEPSGTISNWLLTPTITFSNGDPIRFYTRTSEGFFPDRLEVRLSTNGDSSNVGPNEFSVGDFTANLLTINPNLQPGPENYPTDWTQFTITLAGLSPGVQTGRIGFRYFVTNAGIEGTNSDYIGIDSLEVGVSSVKVAPEPPSFLLILGAVTGIVARRRRH